MSKPLTVYYDGTCGLCHRAVRFIIRRDRHKRFVFAPLQGPRGQHAAHVLGLDPEQTTSLILEMDGRWFMRSDAAWRIAARLDGAWPLLSVLRLVPRFIRNALYDFVAQRRYRWFGRDESCPLPAPDMAERFMED